MPLRGEGSDVRDDGLNGDLVIARFAALVEEALRAAEEVRDDGALGAHFAAVGGAAEFQEGLDFAVETYFAFCAGPEVGALGPGGGEVFEEVGEVHGVVVAVPGGVSGIGGGWDWTDSHVPAWGEVIIYRRRSTVHG